MPDLDSRYAELVAAANPSGLIPPAELRRRADRRARVRAVAAAAGVALVIAGSAATAQAMLIGDDRGGPHVGTDPVPSPSPSPSSSPTPDAPPPAAVDPSVVPTTIPERAFFIQPENTQKEGPRSSDHDGPVLPQLCGVNFASDRSSAAQRTMAHVYGLPDDPADYIPHGVLVQTITSYEDGAAAEFMNELAEAVRVCPRGKEGDLDARYSLVEANDHGNLALLIQVETGQLDIDGNPNGTAVNQVSVVQVGSVVTVLRDTGWEGAETVPAVLDDFTVLAVDSIEQWLVG